MKRDDWKRNKCFRKKRFDTEKKALQSIKTIKKYNEGVNMGCYWCDQCGGWHLYNKNKNGLDKQGPGA